MTTLRARLAGLDREHVDLVTAVALIVALELELRSWLGTGNPAWHRVVTAAAAALLAAPIATRRRSPAASLMVASLVAAAAGIMGGHLSAANGVIVAPILLAYGAGAWLELRRSLVAVVAGGIAFAGFVLSSQVPASIADAGGDAFLVAMLYAAPWWCGRLARAYARRAAAFGDLEARAVAESRERELWAIARERERIGHELQDIIAHSVSAMVIQAGGARLLLRSDPERARDSILTVEETGREALGDLRRLLGMLRKDGDLRALAPQPGLAQLETLLESLSGAGLACELHREAKQIALTPGIDLVGYRVVEAALLEALSNGGSHAAVTVRSQREWLEIEISANRELADLVHELGGISERIALYDGSLRMLPAGQDEFTLLARLPLGVAVPA